MSMAVHGTSHAANGFCSHQPKTCMVMSFKTVFSTCNDNGWMAKKLSAIVCFVALRPKSTAMVIAGQSVHLTRKLEQAVNQYSNRAHTFACN